MMTKTTNSAVYSAYGAPAMKASYQRNLLLSMALNVLMAVIAAGAIVLTEYWAPAVDSPVGILQEDETGIEWNEEEIIVIPDGPGGTGGTRAEPRDVVIPTPVADSLFYDDEDIVIATREELAAAVDGYGVEDVVGDGPRGIGELGDAAGSVGPDDAWKAFVPCEIYPELIYKHPPKYPRLCKQAGITGVVWITALVDEDGQVVRAEVAKSSGVSSLDEAAVMAAYENLFKPGIQNGRPVRVSVTYEVEFVLE